MELHQTIKAILAQMAETPAPPIEALTPEQARGGINPVFQAIAQEAEDILSIENKTISMDGVNIGVRVYRPNNDTNLPALVFYHGGGWVIGNLDTHDSICRALSNGANCVVVSVDYPLAPEYPFPTAANDAFNTLKWVYDNGLELGIDKNRIAVGGDSAGGNLAAVVALMSRDKNGPKLVLQLLAYPVTDVSNFDTQSYNKFQDSFILTKNAMQWFSSHYILNDEDRKNPYVSPLLAKDLSGVAPASIIAAKLDVLFDEGKEYANKLQKSGVEVEYQVYDGMIHLFYGMTGMSYAENGIEQSISALKKAFN